MGLVERMGGWRGCLRFGTPFATLGMERRIRSFRGIYVVDTSALQAVKDTVVNQQVISGLSQRIVDAIKNAAVRTGVDFSYLVNKASQESGFDPNAKTSSSSATGLFQFTNQTWLQMIKQHGAAYGLSNYADHIQIDSNGTAHVSDPVWKKAILDLRQDPQTSAEMAGELDKTNLASLKDNVGGKIGATDLYLAHFLGAGGASDFLNAMKTNPNAKAAEILPEAAAANSSVFYTSSGQARSLSQIYQHFAQKFEGPTSASGSTLVATASQVQPVTHLSSRTSTYINSPSYVASTSSGALPSYVFAGMPSATVSSNNSYTAPVASSIKVDSSSLVTTMILAQMNLGDMNAVNNYTAAAIDDRNKKNLLSTLSGLA